MSTQAIPQPSDPLQQDDPYSIQYVVDPGRTFEMTAIAQDIVRGRLVRDGRNPDDYVMSLSVPGEGRRRLTAVRRETPTTRAEAFNAWAQGEDPSFNARMEEARRQYDAMMHSWNQIQPLPADTGRGIRFTRFAPGQVIPVDGDPRRVQVVTPKAPEEVQEDVKTMKLANRFKVGCDPEFAMLDRTGKLVTLFDRNLTLDSPVGIDHNGRVVELRPAPARSAYTLLRRMKKLLDSEALEPYKAHRWKAGAIAQRQPRLTTLGGHVHLDTLNPIKEFGQYDTERNQALIDALDRYTLNLERLDILPRAEDVERRNSGAGYGFLGDWRTTPGSELDGQQQHMEYRTMSSWLFDPRVAMLCLAGAKFAALAPDIIMDKLPRLGASYTKLKEYFEAFRGKDEDADRVLDKVLHVPISKLHADVTADFKKKWSVLPC